VYVEHFFKSLGHLVECNRNISSNHFSSVEMNRVAVWNGTTLALCSHFIQFVQRICSTQSSGPDI